MSKRIISVLTAIFLLAGMMAGCAKGAAGNKESTATTAAAGTTQTTAPKDDTPSYLNATGFPVVKEPVTLKLFHQVLANQGEWKNYEMFKKVEQITGVHIEFDSQSQQSFKEKLSLILASADLPDMILGGFSNKVSEEELYGGQGILIPLEKHIDKYTTALKKTMEQDAAIKKAITATDGHIYGIPYLYKTTTSAGSILYINMNWLKNVNMGMPKTTDDFYQMLKAFKEKDPNGNKQADEIPVSFWRQTVAKNSLGIFDIIIAGAFSGQAGGTNFDLKDGKVVYNPMEPYFKEFLAFMKKLYEEKLIDGEFLTQTQQQMVAKFKEGKIGVSTVSLSLVLNAGETTPYEIMPPLTSSSNSKMVTPQITGIVPGAIVITKACKYPEAAVRWWDIFYRDFDEAVEGISGLSVGRGVFGEHWNWGDDARTTISTISKDPNLNPTEYYQRFVGPATGFGKIYEEKILPAAANAPLRLKATESIKNYFPYQTPVYPASVRYTKAENDRMIVLTNDIDTYVGQMIAKFVMGEESLDKWDDYVGNLKKLNIDELIKIKQDAYDRWTNIK